MLIPVLIPLLNPNEPEALLAGIHVVEGQHISIGDLLCTLETTKSTAQVAAEAEGYVVGLRFAQGKTVRAGDVLCHLAETANAATGNLEPLQPQGAEAASPASLPKGLRITQPALSLARSQGLDLSHLPVGPLVTENMVKEALQTPWTAGEPAPQPAFAFPTIAFDPTAIIVYGGGGHGKALIDLLRALGTYRIAGIVDDGLAASASPGAVMGLPLLGGGETLPELHRQGIHMAVNAVGGIGNLASRVKVFQRLAEAGFACPTLVHPAALVEPSASLSAGVQIFPHAYVGSEARLEFGVIVNTGVIVSHDCQIGEYANLSPGAILAGEVSVGAGSLVGMGVTVNLHVKIGKGARIGNGAAVKSDVPEGGLVRAGTTWPD